MIPVSRAATERETHMAVKAAKAQAAALMNGSFLIELKIGARVLYPLAQEAENRSKDIRLKPRVSGRHADEDSLAVINSRSEMRALSHRSRHASLLIVPSASA